LPERGVFVKGKDRGKTMGYTSGGGPEWCDSGVIVQISPEMVKRVWVNWSKNEKRPATASQNSVQS
jgi:hypothetical protein